MNQTSTDSGIARDSVSRDTALIRIGLSGDEAYSFIEKLRNEGNKVANGTASCEAFCDDFLRTISETLASRGKRDTDTSSLRPRLLGAFQTFVVGAASGVAGTLATDRIKAAFPSLKDDAHQTHSATETAKQPTTQHPVTPRRHDHHQALHRIRAMREKSDPIHDLSLDTRREIAVLIETTIGQEFAGKPDFELERCRAWANVAYSFEGAHSERTAAARKVDAIVAVTFPGQWEFEFCRVRGWCGVAISTNGSRAESEHAANLVDEISLGFAGQREFDYDRLQAWRAVTYQRRNAAADCWEAARVVDKIALACAGDRDFELERARAWAIVASACRDDQASCRLAARTVDCIALSFRVDRSFQVARAGAWRAVAFAHIGDHTQCPTAAKVVDDVARPFGRDRDFELERASAWRYVADSLAGYEEGCVEAARLVDAIVRPTFAGQAEFEAERKAAFARARLDGI